MLNVRPRASQLHHAQCDARRLWSGKTCGAFQLGAETGPTRVNNSRKNIAVSFNGFGLVCRGSLRHCVRKVWTHPAMFRQIQRRHSIAFKSRGCLRYDYNNIIHVASYEDKHVASLMSQHMLGNIHYLEYNALRGTVGNLEAAIE